MVHRWRAWLLQMVPLSAEYASERGFNAPLFLHPVLGRDPCNPPDLVKRLVDSHSPLAGMVGTHALHIGLDLAALLRTAADGPAGLRSWALEAVQASAPLLCLNDPVLAHLLSRAASGPPPDVREAALLTERLYSVAADQLLLHRWALNLRKAFAPVLVRDDQLSGRDPCLVFRASKLLSHSLLSRTRLPVRGHVPEVVADPVFREAMWLLSCDSARLGVRRTRGLLLIHAPAYLLVAKLLGRPVLEVEAAALPSLNAPKADWFAAAASWASSVASNPRTSWGAKANPRTVAAGLGWALADDVPVLVLRAEAVEAAIGGRQAALPAVASAVPSSRGQPAHLSHVYDGVTLLVARRKFHSRQPPRFYFEPPFEVPETFVPRSFQRLQVKGHQLYDLGALARLSESSVSGATDFYCYAKELEGRLRDNFEAERLSQRHQSRVEEVLAGTRTRLGPFTAVEEGTVRAVLANRVPGPIEKGFWAELASLLPGRNLHMVRKLSLRVIEAEAARVSWKQFRVSPYWPGGNLSRTLFAKYGRRAG